MYYRRCTFNFALNFRRRACLACTKCNRSNNHRLCVTFQMSRFKRALIGDEDGNDGLPPNFRSLRGPPARKRAVILLRRYLNGLNCRRGKRAPQCLSFWRRNVVARASWDNCVLGGKTVEATLIANAEWSTKAKRLPHSQRILIPKELKLVRADFQRVRRKVGQTRRVPRKDFCTSFMVVIKDRVESVGKKQKQKVTITNV